MPLTSKEGTIPLTSKSAQKKKERTTLTNFKDDQELLSNREPSASLFEVDIRMEKNRYERFTHEGSRSSSVKDFINTSHLVSEFNRQAKPIEKLIEESGGDKFKITPRKKTKSQLPVIDGPPVIAESITQNFKK